MKRLSLLASILLLVVASFAQNLSEGVQYELENLLENTLAEDETRDVEQLLNDLQLRREHPVNMNEASKTDLAGLYFLSPFQINSLLDYREKYGQILSVYEIATIDGFNQKLALLLGGFVTFDPVAKSGGSQKQSRHEILLRGIRLLEKQAGFTNGKYLGSPEKLYMRYRFSSTSVLAGFVAEKDAGEPFLKGNNREGFDFYSGFAQARAGKVTITIGDYVVQFGQGLAAWQGFSLGKSTEATQVARFGQGIKPYSSTDENNFMRGTALDWKIGKWQFQPFISFKTFDANTDSVDGEKVFTSIQTSGLHRTASEIADKNSVTSFVAGMHIGLQSNNISIGLTGVHTQYQYPLVRSDDLYNRFLFAGNHLNNISADYRWSINRLFAFGELAGNFSRGVAALNGFLFQPVDQVEISALYRSFGRHYNSPFSSAFAENSRINDEQGLYIGTKIHPAARVSLYMYADFFQYKWIKYTTAAPGHGREYLVQANYQSGKNSEFYIRYFYEVKPVKISTQNMKENRDQVRQSVRVQFSGQLSPQVKVKTRGEQSFYRHDHYSSGYFISQDVGFHSSLLPLSLFARLAYFNTDDYDSRIYSYENDLLYQFSVPAFYSEGIRSYLVGKVKICEKAEFWFKVSRSWFFDVDSLGSGYGLIESNKRTELKFQLRLRI